MNIISLYSNKEVSFRYRGKNLSFFLSQALFSSYDVDKGTRLLLKTLAENPPCSFRTVLDAGCGTGVLGIAVKAADPDTEVTMQDRDCLAARFAGINAEKNGINDAETMAALAFGNLSGRKYDLVLSNLPAKAGRPVLEHFILRSLEVLSDRGCCAVVVVDPLKEAVGEMLASSTAAVTYSESNEDYTVFHYRNTARPGTFENGEQHGLSPYIRSESEFSMDGISYRLKTAYNIPGFDTIPYSASILRKTAAKHHPRGTMFVWNPEQGHIPLIFLSQKEQDLSGIVLASRDVLQVEISALNCAAVPGAPGIIKVPESDALTAIESTKRKYNWIIINTVSIHDGKRLKEILEKSSGLLEKDGFIAFTGKSSLLSDIQAGSRKLRKTGMKKHKGFRMLLFQNSNQTLYH